MAMAPFHLWPWRIPFMAMAHSPHGYGPVAVAPPQLLLWHPQTPGACPGAWPAHHPRVDFA